MNKWGDKEQKNSELERSTEPQTEQTLDQTKEKQSLCLEKFLDKHLIMNLIHLSSNVIQIFAKLAMPSMLY